MRRRTLGIGIRDLTGGFKCFDADVLQAIDLPSVRSRGYAFQVELTYRALVRGFRVVEVPIVFRDRVRGDIEDVVDGSQSRRRGSCRSSGAVPRESDIRPRALKRRSSPRRTDTG